MLSRRETLQLLVGLNEVDDLDLVVDESLLQVSCRIDDKEKVRSMASVIELIYKRFDYERSPEFVDKMDGKSAQVQAMHRRLLDSERRNKVVRRLGDAIVRIEDNDDAYRLVAVVDHYLLNELKSLIMLIPE